MIRLKRYHLPSFSITEQKVDEEIKEGIHFTTSSNQTYFIYPEITQQFLVLHIVEKPDWKFVVPLPDRNISIDDFLKNNNDLILCYANQWLIWGEYPKEPLFRWH